MANFQDGTFDVNMTSLEVLRTRHNMHILLRIYLILKINLNTGQTLGTRDKKENRKI